MRAGCEGLKAPRAVVRAVEDLSRGAEVRRSFEVSMLMADRDSSELTCDMVRYRRSRLTKINGRKVRWSCYLLLTVEL